MAKRMVLVRLTAAQIADLCEATKIAERAASGTRCKISYWAARKALVDATANVEAVEAGIERRLLRAAVRWIAAEDDPGSDDALDVEALRGLLTVCLVSDLFGQTQDEVARAVVRERRRTAPKKARPTAAAPKRRARPGCRAVAEARSAFSDVPDPDPFNGEGDDVDPAQDGE